MIKGQFPVDIVPRLLDEEALSAMNGETIVLKSSSLKETLKRFDICIIFTNGGYDES
jgi:hypothetical protein